MKDKVIYQLSISALLFFGLWFLLSQIDFINIFKVEDLNKSSEKKLGELILKTIKKADTEIDDDTVVNYVNIVKERICKYNDIATDSISIILIENSETNAFALPNKQIVIYSGMLLYCKNPEELAAVIAHEVSHIQSNHIMQKLTKDVGITMLATMAGGNSSNDIVRETIKLLSSTAFDREQEREADALAVEYLSKASIDPEHFANMMFRLSGEFDLPKQLKWINTHPDSKDRAAEILELRKEKNFEIKPILADGEWENLKANIQN